MAKMLLPKLPAPFHSPATLFRGPSVKTRSDVVSKKKTTEALALV